MALGERRTLPRLAGLPLCAAALVLVCMLSIAIGAKAIPLGDVAAGLFGDDGSESAAIVRELRVPRTLVGLAVGVALGLAGALMQALTRNPLADPGLLGVEAGAAAAIVTAIGLLGITQPRGLHLVLVPRRGGRLDRGLPARLARPGRRHPGPARAGRHRGDVRPDRLHQRRSRCSTRRRSTSSGTGWSARWPGATCRDPRRGRAVPARRPGDRARARPAAERARARRRPGARARRARRPHARAGRRRRSR